jgi:hypothetical protein
MMSFPDAKPGSSRRCRNSAPFGEKGEAMNQKRSDDSWNEIRAVLDARASFVVIVEHFFDRRANLRGAHIAF